MNYSKNILMITLFVTRFSFGQKPVVGIKLGIAISNSTIDYTNPNPYSPKTSSRVGVLGGVYLDIASGKKIIFRPGAELVTKGARDENNYPIRFTYLDFPINILYKISYAKGHLIAGGGPSIGVPIREYYSEYPVKTEFGLNALIGYEMAIGFSLNLNYNYGLSNASKNTEVIKKISNRYLGITVGYSF